MIGAPGDIRNQWRLPVGDAIDLHDCSIRI